MRKIILILLLSFSGVSYAQTAPPTQNFYGKLYDFRNGLRVDTALFLPRKDTLTTDATMRDAGMLVYRTVDSLLYYRKGNTMTPLFTGTGSLLDYYTKAQSDARYPLNTLSINTTSPLQGGGNLTADRTFSILDAAADGSTKGAASFTANDFNSTSGNISIDYTNGQAATSSTKGFLTAADWTTFNGKAAATGATGYIWNGTSAQTANYNITGGGRIGGNLGVGTTVIPTSAKLYTSSTSLPQLRTEYTTGNRMDITTGSTGSTTFDLAGSGPVFTFNQQVNVNANVTGSRMLTTVGTSGVGESHYYMTTGSTNYRAAWGLVGTETGSNSGSNLILSLFNDAAGALSTPLFIRRSDGFMGLNTTSPTQRFTVSAGVMYGDGIGWAISNKNTNSTANANTETTINVTVDGTTQTLPNATMDNYGRIYVVNKDFNGGSVIVSSNVIGSGTTYTLTDGERSATFQSDGTSWKIIGNRSNFTPIAGTGIGISGSTITNTAPSQWSNITGGINYTGGKVAIGSISTGTNIGANDLQLAGSSGIYSATSAVAGLNARLIPFTGSGDTEYRNYFNSGDHLFYVSGGVNDAQVEALRITPSGTVGVNEGTPGAQVDVKGTSATTGAAFRVRNSTPAVVFQADNNGQITLFNGVKIITGSGSPASVVTAPPGSMYLNTAGGANATLYIKESGTGNTGWVAK